MVPGVVSAARLGLAVALRLGWLGVAGEPAVAEFEGAGAVAGVGFGVGDLDDGGAFVVEAGGRAA